VNWNGSYKVVNYFNGGVGKEDCSLETAQAACQSAYCAIVRQDAEHIFDYQKNTFVWVSPSQEQEEASRVEQGKAYFEQGRNTGLSAPPYLSVQCPAVPSDIPDTFAEWWINGWQDGHQAAIDERCKSECLSVGAIGA
jgi:hypothetical protein